MKILTVSVCALLSLTALILLFLHLSSKRPFRSFLLHALAGMAALAAACLTSRFTGVGIPVNAYSAVSCAVLGVPAVCGYLLLNLLL